MRKLLRNKITFTNKYLIIFLRNNTASTFSSSCFISHDSADDILYLLEFIPEILTPGWALNLKKRGSQETRSWDIIEQREWTVCVVPQAE